MHWHVIIYGSDSDGLALILWLFPSGPAAGAPGDVVTSLAAPSSAVSLFQMMMNVEGIAAGMPCERRCGVLTRFVPARYPNPLCHSIQRPVQRASVTPAFWYCRSLSHSIRHSVGGLVFAKICGLQPADPPSSFYIRSGL